MIVGGLDPSLRSIGWARSTGSVPALGGFWESGVICPKGTGSPRLWDGLHQVMSVLGECDVVIIEGYAYAASQYAHQIGEMGGVIRLGFHQKGVTVVEAPPAKLKQLATSKGNAGKDAVLAEAIRRLGYPGSSNDEADALWALQFGLHLFGHPGAVRLPKGHLKSLSDVQRPHIPGITEEEF